VHRRLAFHRIWQVPAQMGIHLFTCRALSHATPDSSIDTQTGLERHVCLLDKAEPGWVCSRRAHGRFRTIRGVTTFSRRQYHFLISDEPIGRLMPLHANATPAYQSACSVPDIRIQLTLSWKLLEYSYRVHMSVGPWTVWTAIFTTGLSLALLGVLRLADHYHCCPITSCFPVRRLHFISW
jgi:hypothetical protein